MTLGKPRHYTEIVDSFLHCARFHRERILKDQMENHHGSTEKPSGFSLSIEQQGTLEAELNDFIEALERKDEKKTETRTSDPLRPTTAEDEEKRRSHELARAYEELQRRNDAYRSELAVARRVQATFIPGEKDFPKREELSFAGFYQAMADIGGDLYDVIRVGKNAYGLIIADVSGHGVPAALVTALVKVAFRSKMAWGTPTHEVCKAVNAELFDILGEGERYVTAFIAMINLETFSIEFTNAGHHPGMLLRDDAIYPLDSKGSFLGIFRSPEFQSGTMKLKVGDRLVLYTDGIIEARNYLGGEYGHEQFDALLLKKTRAKPHDLINAITSDLDSFTMGAPANDDRAILCVGIEGIMEEKLAPNDKNAL